MIFYFRLKQHNEHKYKFGHIELHCNTNEQLMASIWGLLKPARLLELHE